MQHGRRVIVLDRIIWQGGGSFRILGAPSIQIAPWRVVKQEAPPDIILIGHDYYDHCSPADVAKLRGENTAIIGNQRVAEIIPGTTVLRDWQSISLGKATIRAIPAHASGDQRQSGGQGGLGFVISLDYYDIYYVGDSQLAPGMPLLRPDILLLPIDGRGRLSLEDALKLVDLLKPRWAIPYNWGGPSAGASEMDAKSFQNRGGKDTIVRLLEVTP